MKKDKLKKYSLDRALSGVIGFFASLGVLYGVGYCIYQVWVWAYGSTEPKLGSFLATCIAIFAAWTSGFVLGCVALPVIQELNGKHPSGSKTKGQAPSDRKAS